jgi:hypothetical protein
MDDRAVVKAKLHSGELRVEPAKGKKVLFGAALMSSLQQVTRSLLDSCNVNFALIY